MFKKIAFILFFSLAFQVNIFSVDRSKEPIIITDIRTHCIYCGRGYPIIKIDYSSPDRTYYCRFSCDQRYYVRTKLMSNLRKYGIPVAIVAGLGGIAWKYRKQLSNLFGKY